MVIIIYSISTKPRHHNKLMRPKSNPTVLQSFETRACVAWVGSLFLSANKTHKNLLRRYIFFQGFSFYFALLSFSFIVIWGGVGLGSGSLGYIVWLMGGAGPSSFMGLGLFMTPFMKAFW